MTSNTNVISKQDMDNLFLSQNGFVSKNINDGLLGEVNIVKCLSIIAASSPTSLRGHIPVLTPDSTIFTPSASSTLNSNFGVWKPFSNNPKNIWKTAADVTTNFWIRIDVPNPVAVHAFSLSGWTTSDSDCIKDWSFQAFNSNLNQWVDLYIANNSVIDNSQYYIFDVISKLDPTGTLHLPNETTYKSFRIYVRSCVNPTHAAGLTHFQIYTYYAK